MLYLDSDLVVNGSLNDLFHIDLKDNFIAAVKDVIAEKCYPKNRPIQFNAGVLLINNTLWREENITQKAITFTEQYNEILKDADQEVLNYLFQDKWIKLHRSYNYLTGFEYINKHLGLDFPIENLGSKIPLIVHYNTEAKPWNDIYPIKFKELYWFYYHLEWKDIIHHHTLTP